MFVAPGTKHAREHVKNSPFTVITGIPVKSELNSNHQTENTNNTVYSTFRKLFDKRFGGESRLQRQEYERDVLQDDP